MDTMPDMFEFKEVPCSWCYEPFRVVSEACGKCNCPKCGKINQIGECGE